MAMDLAGELHAILRSDQVDTSRGVAEQHSHDESYHLPVPPEAVVFAESRDDVVRVMRLAARVGAPVVAFGAGSGLEGHVVPVRGGISLDMTRMNEVLEVRPEDFLVRVQAGVTRKQVNEHLRRYGLFFPVDPGADATLGGMAATGASGTTTVRYGSMRENVRSLEVVLASGQVIRTGSLAAKSASGYNLNNLFIGSEGTLGVFTELWLKVWGIPESTVAARVAFATIEQTVAASTAIIGAGVPVVRMELVDGPYLKYINAYGKTHYPEIPTLLLEFRGSSAAVEADLETATTLVALEGAVDVVQLRDPAEQKQVWDMRHAAAFAFVAGHPGRKHLATDVCVPISKLPEAVIFAKDQIAEMAVPGAIVGHVGDGNFHVSLAVDPNSSAEVALADAYSRRLVEHALAIGGTSTGEHGVGLGKRKFQEQEHGAAIEVMRGIKALLDPQHILNPGKLVDVD